MELLETIKNSVRLTGHGVDEDISGYISAGKAEMLRRGVSMDAVVSDCPEVVQAMKLFVKSELNFAGKGEEYRLRFDRYVDGLRCSEKTSGMGA